MHVDTHASRMMRDRIETAAVPPGSRGPWLRLLCELLTLAGPAAEFLRHAERPWHSATFSGARHTVHLAFEGVAAILEGEAFIAALPEHEFAIPGQLVADATVREVDHIGGSAPRMTVTAELLLLADA